ncbi:MAG: hypothetical protein ACTTHG_03015 [Treponemataceae bacterium]
MKKNILRGKILRLLADFYPNGVELTSLIGIYHAYEKVDDITKSVEYLVDKGFVYKKENPHPYKDNMKVIFYKISPEGLDLVEGNAKGDIGILILPEA